MIATVITYLDTGLFRPPLPQIISQLAISQQLTIKVELVLEEILLNIFVHGYKQSNSNVLLRYYVINGKLYIFLYDNAPQFNIFTIKFTLSQNLDELPNRGNGAKIINGLISSYKYRFKHHTNINLLIFNLN